MDEGGGFLARWARRKSQARSGVVEPDRPAPPPAAVASPAPETPAAPPTPPEATLAAAPPAGDAQRPPPPTLDDVAALTPDADFGRFVARDVDPGVRNAAMKKLFSDPHYNVMDGLDVYIDDYGKPDPIPRSMLRSLAQSRLLGLFDDEEESVAKAAGTAEASPAPAAPGADSPAQTEPIHDEDPDLQLQPDDAAGTRAGEPGGAHPGSDAAGQR